MIKHGCILIMTYIEKNIPESKQIVLNQAFHVINFNLFTHFMIIGLGLIGIPFAFAYHFPSIDYDTSLIELKIIDHQILPLDDTPTYYFDNSDLLKITVKVTNNGVDYFLVSDKMFKIFVMEQDLKNSQVDTIFEIVDNYDTAYDDELEVRYDDFQSREFFEECDYTNDELGIGESKVFTVCYDILRIWNNEVLNLDDSKKYYLVMMNNNQATSCPNCKKILLSSQELYNKYHFPEWVHNLFDWHNKGIISDKEYQDSIEYLVTTGIIYKTGDETYLSVALEDKNQQLKKHQERLSLAYQTNLYVSYIRFYESGYDEKTFSGVTCKKHNNIVTLSGDYTNDDDYYNAVFFKLLVFDDLENVVSTGLSKMVDVVPKEFRHFSVSTPYTEKMNRCFVMTDSKFPKE